MNNQIRKQISKTVNALKNVGDIDLMIDSKDILRGLEDTMDVISAQPFKNWEDRSDALDHMELAREYFEEFMRSYFECAGQAQRSKYMAMRNVKKALDITVKAEMYSDFDDYCDEVLA